MNHHVAETVVNTVTYPAEVPAAVPPDTVPPPEAGASALRSATNQLAGDLAKITYDFPFRIPPFLALVTALVQASLLGKGGGGSLCFQPAPREVGLRWLVGVPLANLATPCCVRRSMAQGTENNTFKNTRPPLFP